MPADEQELRKVLLEIVRIGLSRIRRFGFEGRASDCNSEAYHIHNLPDTIRTLNHQDVLRYFRSERQRFIDRSPPEIEQFTGEWEKLEQMIRLWTAAG